MARSEDSDKLWTLMARLPPASWESAHMQLLIDYARRTARSFGADEYKAEDAGLEVAYKILRCDWWRQPGPNSESPQALRSYIAVAVRRQLIDQYRKWGTVESREESLEGLGRTAAELPRFDPAESRPDFNPEDALTHNRIDAFSLNEIYQVLSDCIVSFSGEILETYLFLVHYTGVSADPSAVDDDSVHLLAEFIGILSGSLRPKDFVEAMLVENPQLNRNQARKRLQRIQRAFKPFNQRLRGLF